MAEGLAGVHCEAFAANQNCARGGQCRLKSVGYASSWVFVWWGEGEGEGE